MKLATLKQGGRDGTLVVASHCLALCQPVPDIAPTLQAALDDWNACEPRLREVDASLNNGHACPAVAGKWEVPSYIQPMAFQWNERPLPPPHMAVVVPKCWCEIFRLNP
ncbi:MAG: hypothetical protein ACYCSR_07615 [Thiomonas sp.]